MRVMKLKEAYPTAKVEVWSEDEHRLGLKPIIRKAFWGPVGERPIVRVHQRYEWTYTSTPSPARRPGRFTGWYFPP